jgi:hypothetical protein
MKLKKMIVVISLISLFLFDKVVLAQNIQLYPGQSIRINQDIISCQGVSPYPSSMLGCMIENKGTQLDEYYLYAVDSSGKRTELTHSSFIENIIQTFQANRNQNGPCKLGRSTCYVGHVVDDHSLGQYVLYSNFYGKTTIVDASVFNENIQRLLVQLQQAGICE